MNSRLKITRLVRGLTQYDLAFKTKVHQSRISLIERGYAKPNAYEKRAIEKALGKINWGGDGD